MTATKNSNKKSNKKKEEDDLLVEHMTVDEEDIRDKWYDNLELAEANV